MREQQEKTAFGLPDSISESFHNFGARAVHSPLGYSPLRAWRNLSGSVPPPPAPPTGGQSNIFSRPISAAWDLGKRIGDSPLGYSPLRVGRQAWQQNGSRVLQAHSDALSAPIEAARNFGEWLGNSPLTYSPFRIAKRFWDTSKPSAPSIEPPSPGASRPHVPIASPGGLPNQRVNPIDYANVGSIQDPYSRQGYQTTLQQLNDRSSTTTQPGFVGPDTSSVSAPKYSDPSKPFGKSGQDLLHAKLRPRQKCAAQMPETNSGPHPALRALLRFGPAALLALPAAHVAHGLTWRSLLPGKTNPALTLAQLASRSQRAATAGRGAGLLAGAGTGYGVQRIMDKNLIPARPAGE